MSSSLCQCPLPTEFTDIDDFDCGFKIGLVSRIAFQRIGTGSEFIDPATAITLEASWDTFLAAADSTKIQLSPIFGGAEVAPSEAIVQGGNDNTTPLGQPIVTGDTIPVFTGQFFNITPEIKKQLKEFACEGTLGVYFVDNCGAVYGESVDSGVTTTPIPISQFFIGTRGLGGITAADTNNFQFNLRTDWDENLTKAIPAFDLLTKTNV